eukprot:m51a1_g9294 hypothetical protein (206) ;mRNA; r:35900-38635
MTDPDEVPEVKVTCEFLKSTTYQEKRRAAFVHHLALKCDPKAFYMLGYAFFTNKHKLHSSFVRLVFFDLLNFKRSIWNLQLICLLISKCNKSPKGLYKSCLFFMLYSSKTIPGFAIAFGVLANRLINGILKHYPTKKDKIHQQLNLHSPLHLFFYLINFGPAAIWDTKRTENAQAKVSEFANQMTRHLLEVAKLCAGLAQPRLVS